MSVLKKLSGQTALYGIPSIIGRVLNFLLVPFYTSKNVLNVAEFGIYTEIYAYMAFLNVIYTFGMETTYFRFSTKTENGESESFNNAQSAVLITSLLFSSCIIIFSQPIADLLRYPDKQSYIIFLGLILAFDAIVAIPFARLRLENKAGRYAFVKMFNIILTIFLNLFFLVFCKQISEGNAFPELKSWVDKIYIPHFEVGYIFISNLLANALQIPFLWKSFVNLKIQIKWNKLKPMLVYAYPLMVMGLAGMVNEVLDRILLKFWLPQGFYPGLTNIEAVGIYGACYKLSMFMSLAIQAFRYAADPFFFSKSKDKNAPELFARVMKYFIIVCVLIYVSVGANLDLFGFLLLRNEAYRAGLMIVPVLLMANLFLGVYYNLAVWFKLTDKTYFGTIISIAGALITIIANFILIPILGYLGCAIATLICYFFMAAASFILGNKYFPIPYKLGSAFFYIVLGSILVFLANHFKQNDQILNYAMQFSTILIYLLIVFMLERKKVGQFSRPQ
jgi:O-antigen/teichoic acid export membrane protein